MGSDGFLVRRIDNVVNFNPRSPDGERLTTLMDVPASVVFQSTLPGWGATISGLTHTVNQTHFNPRSPDGERLLDYVIFHAFDPFQSTLPGWGATRRIRQNPTGIAYFNPRSPDGERRRSGARHDPSRHISIHAPRMGSDGG